MISQVQIFLNIPLFLLVDLSLTFKYFLLFKSKFWNKKIFINVEPSLQNCMNSLDKFLGEEYSVRCPAYNLSNFSRKKEERLMFRARRCLNE